MRYSRQQGIRHTCSSSHRDESTVIKQRRLSRLH